jgi:hypothetical protein
LGIKFIEPPKAVPQDGDRNKEETKRQPLEEETK